MSDPRASPHIRVTEADIGKRFRWHGPWGERVVAVARIIEWTDFYGLPVWEDDAGDRFLPYLPADQWEPLASPPQRAWQDLPGRERAAANAADKPAPGEERSGT